MKVLLFLLLLGKSPTKDTVTPIGVYNEILEQGLEFPDIVFAQAVLESGNFTSRISKYNNNLFGMRQPKKRQTTSTGTLNGYATYESWRESIADYMHFQEMIFAKHKFTRQSYLRYINKYYSTTKGYTSRLMRVIRENKKILYEPPSDRNDGSLVNSLILP